ncbi:SDR family oxidoreductase [Amycolatopsis acidiphila]|uniref:SDR family oxidoreductase n=1 Tax=Amycolatopsis acidiphila TaxID=715473 RepID=A0A558AP40_9PSEU|nr:SDR family NAD(P)-dependent oxidoreductase [Amycolatopsis acidiphila]TVT26007.1 SDR family oxidoreductase [Amycolatopsis acidiphila]UIJ63279.1 SDR family oxidoreductase [Amycolatopsis acidiphila]GHG74747.1 short chain dehydrogenase [Amycolatopsis acidiphila]
MTLAGKGVVITGAGAGIGRATALHLAAAGARVVVSDVAEDGGKATVEDIRAAGGTAEFVACDVSDEAGVDELIERSVAFLGGLDLAVNNAGIAHAPCDLHELAVQTWDGVMAVDLRGTFLCLRAELGVMQAAGHGSIVNMASNAGVKNAPGMAAYTAAKHGIVGLTKNAALQYARRGIRVNAVCPGTIATPGIASYPAEMQREWGDIIPMGRLGTPEEVARSVAFLLSAESSFLTGVELLVDGGLMYD